MGDIVAKPWLTGAAYQHYVNVQREKTQRMKDHQALKRLSRLIGLLSREFYGMPYWKQPGGSIPGALAVGCRNITELLMLHAAGFDPVGIDLVAMHEIIHPMDFHKLDYPDARFEAVLSCHSLEHAYDIHVALTEWSRVLVKGGLIAIEIPIRFEPTDVDRHDLKSAEELSLACAEVGIEPLIKHTHAEAGIADYVGRKA